MQDYIDIPRLQISRNQDRVRMITHQSELAMRYRAMEQRHEAKPVGEVQLILFHLSVHQSYQRYKLKSEMNVRLRSGGKK
ncbi:hypothetical protein Dole_3142 [Desulfosudis oleivorans Hxd3]|uniref:Uncharacterized protein n=1 Tax=Desulfosudis oleivorans (strain DSM 6200 / JCM 39069 / Hxd3) TaxID=96561 RepID=A8ZZS3_DESOH|nr:hypothetical protein Dole_3142 [Desulfosudis oleivorans Hxd3]